MQTENIPHYFPELTPWLDAAKEGRFLLPQCMVCERPHWYPRGFCPFCNSHDVAWVEAAGGATVYAVSVVPGEVPYAVAYVTLDEGPIMLTNIVAPDLSALTIGQRVRVSFDHPRDGLVRPAFVPA